MNLFVYDMLVDKSIASIVGLNIKNEWIGVMYGQLWSYNHIPIAIPLDQIRPLVRRGSNKVLGKIYDIEETENSLRLLHSFYGSNAQKLKFRHSSDLFLPHTESIQKIKYETVADICNFTYQVAETCLCTVFIGNADNASIKRKIKVRDGRVITGASDYFKQWLRNTFMDI